MGGGEYDDSTIPIKLLVCYAMYHVYMGSINTGGQTMIYMTKDDVIKYLTKRREILVYELKRSREADARPNLSTKLEGRIDEVDLMLGHIAANCLPTIEKSIVDI